MELLLGNNAKVLKLFIKFNKDNKEKRNLTCGRNVFLRLF